MKKLTEYKELDAATFDNSRLLTIGDCVGSNEGKNWETAHPFKIAAIAVNSSNKLYFGGFGGVGYSYAAEIIERYPRDVPRGVSELPEDKPFLAYLGKYITEQINPFPKGAIYIHTVTVIPGDIVKKWGLLNHPLPPDFFNHVAIDVSSEGAAENYPEIVEAMEYEPVYTRRYSDVNLKDNGMTYRAAESGYLIGHKLGNQYYDLDWNEVSSRENLFLKPEDVFGGEEPPDLERFLDKMGDQLYYYDQVFNAGKARERWEALQELKK